jgi:isoleucyl-tRNA synthetase
MAEPATRREFSFVEAEHDVLDFWERERIFERSLAQTADRRAFVFYDGPPFATGLPHHGHLVASTIKDIVPRYWTMKGRYVERRFGWDCHGLPVEHEIDKQLGASAVDLVPQLGIKGYNDECRKIVQRYTREWRHTIERLGRWVDFDHDYKTMDVDYMESVWWVIKQLWERGLIYQDFKVMPYSTELTTVLSNFEAGLNYQDVQDPSVTVLYKLDDEDAYLACWTTTPWTLPSNLAVCAGPDIEYVKAHDDERGIDIYLAKARLADYQKRHPLTVVAECKGRDLEGRTYAPMFPYFAAEKANGAFRVLVDDYVTTDEGTGLVHQAPAFGEDDFRIARANGIEATPCPLDEGGRFTMEVPDFHSEYVKDADRNIIRHLRDAGVLYEQDVIVHNYPYCWRSDTPLIYRAIPSWFVRVTDIKDALLASNAQVNWVPEHIKEGRFGNFLRGAIDWSISRNRVWGNPLPIWVNDETGSALCMGSIDELEQYTGVRVADLHRENVDDLTFELEGEEGTYRRIEEVLDTWFDSGSMPYAQLHYPFENTEQFENGFPAEFIAEGLDQTRGWFYTLTVLSTALFGGPAYKNVIVNGIVVAEDGKKMSKSLRNYTPPDELMETYGADALRLYLINSGLVRGEEQRFSDSGVREMVRRALLPWYNAFNFLRTYTEIDRWSPAKGLHFGDNILDRWILSKLQTLKAQVAVEMEHYRLYNVVPRLFEFIEDLTNWYIRLNRSRYWGEDVTADKLAAYSTLYTALLELSQVMAPFAPFLSEFLYRELRGFGDEGERAQMPASVHLCAYPEAEEGRIQPRLEDAVRRMQQVILLGRQKREDEKVKLRTPLPSLTIVHREADLLGELQQLEQYVRGELNVKEVRYSRDEAAYIKLYAKPNFPVLGKRLGKRMREFQRLIESMDVQSIESFQERGEVELGGERFGEGDIDVFREALQDTNAVSDRLITIDLNCDLNDSLMLEGMARDVVHHVQRARRELDLNVSDRIAVTYAGDEEIEKAVEAHGEYISGEILGTSLEKGAPQTPTFEVEVEGRVLRFSIEVSSGKP